MSFVSENEPLYKHKDVLIMMKEIAWMAYCEAAEVGFKDQFEKCYMAVSSFDPEDWIMKQKAEASFVQTNAHKVE